MLDILGCEKSKQLWIDLFGEFERYIKICKIKIITNDKKKRSDSMIDKVAKIIKGVEKYLDDLPEIKRWIALSFSCSINSVDGEEQTEKLEENLAGGFESERIENKHLLYSSLLNSFNNCCAKIWKDQTELIEQQIESLKKFFVQKNEEIKKLKKTIKRRVERKTKKESKFSITENENKNDNKEIAKKVVLEEELTNEQVKKIMGKKLSWEVKMILDHQFEKDRNAKLLVRWVSINLIQNKY